MRDIMSRPEPRTERGVSGGLRVLVVDDERDIRELLDMTLARMGLACDCAASVAEAKALLRDGHYRLCLTDMRMPDADGLELVRHIEARHPALPVAVITAHGSTDNAVAALKAGAFDYLSKPVSLVQLRNLVKSALALPGDTAAEAPRVPQLLGASEPMRRVRAIIAKVGRSEAPIYLSGESGSGKELAARLVHRESARSNGPFVAVNCGAIPENLMESEFFGYRKGAFTGAESEREGFFQAAAGGTLFLDEVADLPLGMQVKLLRAIQEKHVRRVGATTEEPVDARIICATHQDLHRLVAEGRFRQDLLFRINVIEIPMPPLRDCRADIPDLVEHILARLAKASNRPVPAISPAALSALQDYGFPGNVRELENILERALALHGEDGIDVFDLRLSAQRKVGPGATAERGERPLQEYLDDQERAAIRTVLAECGYNRTAAARRLGISFRSLRYRIERLALNDLPAR